MGEAFIIPAIPQIPSLDRYLGCILGGALGDALGYTAEEDGWEQIENDKIESGIRSPLWDPVSGKALISSNTQMSIFTIDGILHNVANNTSWELHGGPNFSHLMTLSYRKWLLYADARRTAGSELSTLGLDSGGYCRELPSDCVDEQFCIAVAGQRRDAFTG
jgi:ADP-ribosylglycohydrolase